MSERLEPTEVEETVEESEISPALMPYSSMKVDVGALGSDFYFSLPTFTILVETEEEIGPLSDEFRELFSKYTDSIIVGTPQEATLVVSLNQAAANMDELKTVIGFLREKIKELTGSYDAAGDWEDKS